MFGIHLKYLNDDTAIHDPAKIAFLYYVKSNTSVLDQHIQLPYE